MTHNDRNRHGGGVLLYIKDNITTTKVTNHALIEFLFVEITLRQCPFSFGLFYRPPPPSADSLTELEDFLASLPPSKLKSAVLLHDFNINLLSSSSQDIISIMSSFHLLQIVNPLESPPPPRPLLTMSMSLTLLSSTRAKHFYPLDLPTTPVFL